MYFPRYDINSNDYDTSEKSRIPAWTDRILFRKRHPTSAEEKNSGQLNYGEILFYGRAELKTSDHRPVLGEFKIDILKVDTERRTKVFRNVIEMMGPLDATVIIQDEDAENSSVFDEVYVAEILNTLGTQIGEVILARFGDDHMRVTFKDGTLALKLAQIGYIDVLEKRFLVTLKTPNWTDLVEEEVNFGVSNTIPLVEGCKECDIDDLNDYDLSKVSRPSSPSDSEASYTVGVSALPARPPPPAPKAVPISNGVNVSERMLRLPPINMDYLSFQVSLQSNAVGGKPVRPAPPPPRPAQPSTVSKPTEVPSALEPATNSSIFNSFGEELDDSFNSSFNSSFSMPPPAVPPPSCFTDTVNNEPNDELTADIDDSFDEPNSPAPSLPPPSLPAPSLPPPLSNNIPPAGLPPVAPPIPSRRPPTIPPRNT